MKVLRSCQPMILRHIPRQLDSRYSGLKIGSRTRLTTGRTAEMSREFTQTSS